MRFRFSRPRSLSGEIALSPPAWQCGMIGKTAPEHDPEKHALGLRPDGRVAFSVS